MNGLRSFSIVAHPLSAKSAVMVRQIVVICFIEDRSRIKCRHSIRCHLYTGILFIGMWPRTSEDVLWFASNVLAPESAVGESVIAARWLNILSARSGQWAG